MEEVDAVNEDGGLVVADIGPAKGLPDAVGGRDDIAVHYRDRDAFVSAPGNECMVEIRQAEQDGAPVAAGADQEDAELTPGGALVRKLVSDLHEAPPWVQAAGRGDNDFSRD